tara:strand:+ start:2038 stop:2268 length:231 start_codon:yes stop_codon:yes gene_type:complete
MKNDVPEIEIIKTVRYLLLAVIVVGAFMWTSQNKKLSIDILEECESTCSYQGVKFVTSNECACEDKKEISENIWVR